MEKGEPVASHDHRFPPLEELLEEPPDLFVDPPDLLEEVLLLDDLFDELFESLDLFGSPLEDDCDEEEDDDEEDDEPEEVSDDLLDFESDDEDESLFESLDELEDLEDLLVVFIFDGSIPISFILFCIHFCMSFCIWVASAVPPVCVAVVPP